MRLTIFGATGGIGGHLVTQALDAGHHVTAVVRDPARLRAAHPALTVAAVPDLGEPGVLAPLLQDSDAALSAIGPRGRHAGPVASTTTGHLLTALHTAGVDRIVVVSAAPVGPSPDGDSILSRRLLTPVVSAILKDVYTDLRAMEDLLAAGPAQWTALRPPKLSGKPLTGRYRTAPGGNVPRGYTIGRADAAHAMLAALTDPATSGRPLGVAY